MLNRIEAALIFFTRLPFYKIFSPPPAAYERVVELWPLAGWLTGGLTALTIFALGFLLPPLPAVVAALALRALATGCLHEDGLADWWDGMGGGHTPERILAIMKDSHIGTYGVAALIFYWLLTASLLGTLPPFFAAAVMLAADPWSKACAAQIINRLPYARTRETAKNHTVYTRMSAMARVGVLVAGLLPAGVACVLLDSIVPALALPAPIVVATLTIRQMRRSIGGYSGDCCGATALMCELSYILTATILIGL